MTQAEILVEVRFQAELRGLSEKTWKNYTVYIRQYQNYYGKPADELSVEDVQNHLHHLCVPANAISGAVGCRQSPGQAVSR